MASEGNEDHSYAISPQEQEWSNKNTLKLFKVSFSRTFEPILIKHDRKSSLGEGSLFVLMKGHIFAQEEINWKY